MTAVHEGFEVRVYEGSGRGLMPFTGWRPVVYTERQLSQPPFTLSTADRVLCDDCHGWGLHRTWCAPSGNINSTLDKAG
ncbi:hypothetical protein AB0D13_08285 [Streptomyces sp. NPDC048430]|uniref:hypothetical protein n=1 Tax=Streptomyces sp. NPDC048430 TaxID=3155388 RepID=UPI0034255A35